jgi:hypothetical protein
MLDSSLMQSLLQDQSQKKLQGWQQLLRQLVQEEA